MQYTFIISRGILLNIIMTLPVIAIVVFALYDYFGFTYSFYNNKVRTYRISQGIFQISISIICFWLGGFKAALIFNLLWWTWWADWLFYFFCFLFNFKGNRKDKFQPFEGNVRWAFWTPLGLLQLLFLGKESEQFYRIIKPFYLVLQSVLGLIVSVLIYLFVP